MRDIERGDRTGGFPARIAEDGKLLILAGNPEALKNNIKRLAADEDLYRLKAGSYRIIFRKEERRLLILIIRIGHRREIYLALK